MRTTQRISRLLGMGVLLTICIVLVGTVPPSAVDAVLVDETMDDDLPQFEEGGFIRTALYKDLPFTEEQPNNGHIKLTRMGALDELISPGSDFTLPNALFEHGAATIGEQIYIVGGRDENDDHQKAVYMGRIDTSPDARDDNGLPTGIDLVDPGWNSELDLPETLGLSIGDSSTDQFSTTLGLADMAVVAYDSPGFGPDYIYVLGGTSRESAQSELFSSWSVYIGTVDPNTGRITGWTTSDDVYVPSRPDNQYPLRIPGQDFDGNDNTATGNKQLGLQGAAATTVTISDTTYLYLAGGASRVPLGFETILEASRKAYVARIGADGRLYQPGTTGTDDAAVGWGVLPDIPVTPEPGNDDPGLYNLMLVSGNSPEGNAVLYAIAGQTDMGELGVTSPKYTGAVYRADVQSDGNIVWDPSWGTTLPNPLTGHAGVQINSSIFILGGFFAQGGSLETTPTRMGWSSYLEDDLYLHNFGTEEDKYYFQNPDETAPPLPGTNGGRGHHAVAALSLAGADFVYVLGGQGPDGVSSSVSFFRLQESTPEDTPYAPSGWYTSRIYEIELQQAEIEEITWDVTFPNDNPNMDIRMEYRTANVADCDAPGWSNDDWAILEDGGGAWVEPTPDPGKYSSGGQNTYHIPEPRDPARCFQYRALLSTNDTASSPRLDRVGLRIFSPDSPDINVLNLSPVWDAERGEGFLEDMDITIQNLYTPEPSRTLDANVENRPGYNFFYVDMFVFGPDFQYETPPASIILPYDDEVNGATIEGGGTVKPILTAGNEAEMYGLSKVALPATAQMDLDWWCEVPAPDSSDPCVEYNIPDLFERTGTYHICLALDAYVDTEDMEMWPSGYVTENMVGAEDNNYACTEMYILVVATVTLDRSPIVVQEGSSGTFTITMDKMLHETLTIPFTLSGTATAGDDYTLLDGDGQPVALTGNTGQIVVPAGETTETLTLQAVNEGPLPREQKHETVVLSLDADSGTPIQYLLASPSETMITIEDPNIPFMIRMPMMSR